jgi:hypothetical protein
MLHAVVVQRWEPALTVPEIRTALRREAVIAILPPDQAVPAMVLTVRQTGSLPPAPTAPVEAVQEPMTVMVPAVAALVIITAPVPVVVVIPIPHLRREQFQLQQDGIPTVTEQLEPALQALQTLPGLQQLRLQLLQDKPTARLLQIQPIRRAVRLQVHRIHLHPVLTQAPVRDRAPVQVQRAHAAAVHQ